MWRLVGRPLGALTGAPAPTGQRVAVPSCCFTGRGGRTRPFSQRRALALALALALCLLTLCVRVKTGRLIVEIGGHCEFGEVKHFLTQVAKKLPFQAQAVSKQTLQEMRDREEERQHNNQNPWTFEPIVTANMLGIRKYLSPYVLQYKGRYWGRFYLPDRV